MESVPPSLRPIENLPFSLITEEILTRVPIRDAVRTSVLSSEWRHRWKYIPDLRFRGDDNIPIAAIDRVYLSRYHHQSLSSLNLRFFGELRPSLDYSLFSFHSLKSLFLYKCSIPHSSNSPRFPLLTALDLHYVSFPNDRWLPDLIFESSELTDLTLHAVTPSPSNLTLGNPKLRYFIFDGQSCKSIIFAAAQVLEEVCIWFYGDSTRFDLAQSFSTGAVCNGTLDLSRSTVMGLAERRIPRSVPNCFENLIVLDIQVDFSTRKQVMLLLSLMRSAPNLQKIIIQGGDEDDHQVHDGGDENTRLDRMFWKKHMVGLLDNLRIMDVTLYMFVEAEINFLLRVIETARLLQTLDLSMSKDMSDSVLEVLRNCSKASPQVEIIYERY